ncbi:MAG: hypothetical protein HXX10_00630 [Rhodoplanes sp.]|uniref:hypothetical protein n=1 Tax=Rhodoplanes sp. TaxID=1968906 RepID=UPI0017BD3D38|nr:hypothetical protein [Rhodoplanes sp.]NVO12521.1 hypothetical protein [Rhodoplanes sp.]
MCASLLGLLLGGCFVQDRSYVLAKPDETSGSWRIEHRIDRITGKPAPTAFVTTMLSNNKTTAIRPALVQVMCFEDKPIVRFSFDLRVGADRNSTFAYRVDNRPGSEVDATFLEDRKTIAIDDTAVVARFIEDVSAGSMLLVRTESLFAGRTVAEFRIVGAKAAFAPVLEACPLPAGAPARPAT